MALRTSKITSEIIQTCSKRLSSSADQSLKNKFPASTEDNSKPRRPFRYKIANTEKPQGLPQLSFHDEGAPLFAELQPSADPEFRFDFNPPRWAEKPIDNSPFPAKIKPMSDVHTTYSDQQKAEDKLVKFRMASFTPHIRNFSTVSSSITRCYSRSPADNSSKDDCAGKVDKCARFKRKECKVNANKACPRLKVDNCKQSKGSNCDLHYLDPHCVKKFAPYPSYSEACAEQLPDDPSECQQCPWRTCDNADTIEPGKPVRNKRHYSTSCIRHLDATSGVMVSSHLPAPSQVQDYICERKCGVTKTPCKEPLGPCEERKQQEERKRKEKTPHHSGSKKKKASDVDERMVLRSLEAPNMILNPYTLESVRITLERPSVPNQRSCNDIIKGPEVLVNKKQKHPFCKKDKRPKRPKGNVTDKEENLEIIEYGIVDWWSGRGKKTVVTEPLGSQEDDCKKEKCRKQHIRNKKDLGLDVPEMLLKTKGGNKRIKGDEGHPPPCIEQSGESRQCPDKPLKKPKYQKRPSSTPFYKNPEEPYTPNS